MTTRFFSSSKNIFYKNLKLNIILFEKNFQRYSEFNVRNNVEHQVSYLSECYITVDLNKNLF